jgi:small subunit ribosomal protein S9
MPRKPKAKEDDKQPQAEQAEQPQAAEAEAPPAAEPEAEAPQAAEPEAEAPPAAEPKAESPPAAEPEVDAPAAEAEAEAPAAEPEAEQPQAEEPQAEEPQPEPVAAASGDDGAQAEAPGAEEESSQVAAAEAESEPSAPRAKPAVPGAHLEVDLVPEGVDPLGRAAEGEEYEDRYAIEEEEEAGPATGEAEREEEQEILSEPIATAAIDLAADARYRATGKRKSAIARVTLRPGSGAYVVNGRSLEQHFPRVTLQRNIRQPLETVGYHERMDVVARLHGGGISAQAGALRHGVSRALLEADPNLRGELKRRGFLTRDSRAKERKKAGLKKARKRPQFSKR